MKTICLDKKHFELKISRREILKQVERLAAEINRDYGEKEILFLPVLNGSFIFAADLIRKIEVPNKVDFVSLASYDGEKSQNEITTKISLPDELSGKHIIIVEDIVETGNTLRFLCEQINLKFSPASLAIATMFHKPSPTHADLPIKYVGMPLPPEFIVGYGLDYNGYGRNFEDIYAIIK